MERTLNTQYVGEKGSLFALAFKLSLMTVATLGLYRFWMKTRLRRWYWSAVQPGGHPLEYTGNALEKLLGFLIAVVFLAFYIGIVNLILMYASFTLFGGNAPAYVLSFVGVVPLVFYAQYRARRYVLARTRWRGIRFGLEPGAWAYARRALMYWTFAVLTLGLLWPLQTFRLEQFRTDRTWFGTGKMRQGGKWSALIVPWLPCLLSIWVTVGFGAYAAEIQDPFLALHLLYLVPLVLFLYMFYSVRAFRYLSSHKRLGGAVRLTSKARVARVVGIHLLGNALVGFFLSMASGVAFFVLGIFMAIDAAAFEAAMMGGPSWITVGAGIAGYFGFFVMWDVLRQVFVRVPLLAHYASTMQIENAHALADMDQRARDEMEHAEGFAEALDVGAAL